MIRLKDIVEANADLMMADLDGEAVLLNVHSGRYFGLNAVATSIWTLMKEPMSVESIVDAIQSEYNAGNGELMNDIIKFLEDMEARSLIQIVSPVHA